MDKGAGKGIDAALSFLDIGARERGCRGGRSSSLGDVPGPDGYDVLVVRFVRFRRI